MMPCLEYGDIALFFSNIKIKPGKIVIFEHDGIEKVKRVKSVKGKEVYVLGDNASKSKDSRTFGCIKKDSIKGVMMIKW